MTRFVVIGGTGLIGSKVTAKLEAEGHEAIPASPKTGVNTLTKEGLAEVLTGTQVVVDVSNSPSFDDDPVLEFFTTSTRNLLAEETAAGVGHRVALSVVGTPDWSDSGYFRARPPKRSSSTNPMSLTQSCGQRSSSNSSTASPPQQLKETRFAFHPLLSNR